MKKIIFLLSACMLIALMGYSQEISPDKVPPAVKAGFAKQYPKATDVKYQMEKMDYEITFMDNGVEKSAIFNAYGRWNETEKSIAETELPKKVLKSIEKNFPGYVKSEISSLETPTVKLCYEMDLKNDKQGYEVRFSPKGEILRRVPLKKEKHETPGNEMKK